MLYNIIFLSLAAFFNACMDKMWNHFSSSVFPAFAKFLTKIKIFKSEEVALKWLDAQNSWRNIYIDGKKENGRIVLFTILGFKVYKPSFISDGWHFSKGLMILNLSLACSFSAPFLLFSSLVLSIISSTIIYSFIWGIIFELFFSKLLNK